MESRGLLYILGSGGLAREIEAYAGDVAGVRFVDDQAPGAMSVADYHLAVGPSAHSIMGAGWCEVKKRMLTQIRAPFLSLVHPSAVVLSDHVGEGTVVAPSAVVALGAVIGNHVLVNYLASVGHDTKVGNLGVISPNASIGGNCVLEEEVFVGAGANIKQGLRIGRGAVIGMGAVVTKDVPAGVTAKGVPAGW